MEIDLTNALWTVSLMIVSVLITLLTYVTSSYRKEVHDLKQKIEDSVMARNQCQQHMIERIEHGKSSIYENLNPKIDKLNDFLNQLNKSLSEIKGQLGMLLKRNG
jgi:hypothetical protein